MKGPLNKLREVVNRSPGDAQSWHLLGIKALEAGELAEAGQALLRSAQLAPHEIDRALSAGLALLDAGRLIEAEQIVRLVCEHAPTRGDAQIALAKVHIANGRESEAIGVLGRVLRSNPRSIDAHLLAAGAYNNMGMFVDASDHLALVLAADSYHLEATRRLAEVLGRMGDSRGLIRCLRRIATLTRGEDFEVLTTLGITLSSVGRHPEAIEVLNEVAKRRRDVGSAYADLGLAQMAADRVEDALASMSKALSLDSRSAQAHCGLGLCYQKMGRWKEAAQAFAATEQLAPELVVGPLNLGLVLDALGDRAGSRQALLRAAALEPDDQEIRVALEKHFMRNTGGDATHTTAEMSTSAEAVIAGDLATVSFLDLLEYLRLQNKSGTLTVTVRRGTGTVRLLRGQITSASSPGTKRFDQALIEARLIGKSALESLLARTGHRDRESAESLGTLLLREGAVEQRPLAQVVARRIHEALTEILKWTEGAFSFHPEDGQAAPAIFFNLQDVTMQLVRVGDERRQGMQGPAR
jgi:tetratricopeptide (TPR) repeat protein